MLRRRVLRLVQNHHRVVQRSSAHERQRCNLNHVLFHVFRQFLRRNHVLQGIVERLQIGVNLVPHVAWQKAQLLASLHSRATQDNLPDFLIFQGTYRQGNRHIRLARPGRTHRKQHVILVVGIHQRLLVLRTCRNRLARHTVADSTPIRSMSARLFPLYNLQNRLLVQGIIFRTMLLHLRDVLLKRTHLLLVTHHLDDIPPRHNPQLRIQRLDHLQVDILHPVERHEINVFQNYHFLNHGAKVVKTEDSTK